MLTQENIAAIAALPANAYKFKCHIDSLIQVYLFCRSQWTTKAIHDLTVEQGLNLRKKEDKAKFGWFAAQELTKALPPAPKKETYQSAKTVKVLCQALALLPPVPPTNGLENAPAYRIMGSPIYADELNRNYKQLVQKWHPDLNPSLEAVGRFQTINEVYQALRAHWFEKYSPLLPIAKIGQENIDRAMNKTFDFTPESFWA